MTNKLTHRIVTSFTILCAAIALSACNEDDTRFAESIAAAQAEEAGLSIIGKPGTVAVQDTQYDFQPRVRGADGTDLIFSIRGKPEWAVFMTDTGRLTGTPSPAEVGMRYRVQISVSDGAETVKLPAFMLSVVAYGTSQVTLGWQPPSQNEDGTPLTDLAGYRIYWGTVDGEFPNVIDVDNPGLSTYVVDNLVPNTYHFATTAYDADGFESVLSNVASTTVN